MTKPRKIKSKKRALILERLLLGHRLSEICLDKGMPTIAEVKKLAMDEPNDFGREYREVLHINLITMADEMIEIADDGTNDFMKRNAKTGKYARNSEAVSRSKLRVDTRQWLMAKMLPEIFPETLTVEHNHNVHDLSSVSTKDLEKMRDILKKAR